MTSPRRVGRKLMAYAVVAGLFGAASAFAQQEPANLQAAGGMDRLVAMAKQEGALLLYGAPSQDKMEEWFKGFQQKYGIGLCT
jgi:hypothetical protein